MTIMPLNTQILVLDTVAAHNGLLAIVESSFNWFEGAVAGSEATQNIEDKLAEMDSELSKLRGLNETMRNEWGTFKRTITTAYGNFGRDVVTRIGYDEQSRVRDLSRSTAAGALTRIRDNARLHLTRTLEGIRD